MQTKVYSRDLETMIFYGDKNTQLNNRFPDKFIKTFK